MTFVRCVTLCILLIACADESRPATSDFATVRDSAGIVLVRNHTAEWTLREGWRVSPTPILEIPDSALLGEGRYVIAGARSVAGASARIGRCPTCRGSDARTTRPSRPVPPTDRAA